MMVLLLIAAPCGFDKKSFADFPTVAGPCHLTFPRDHASHPDYRIEWWYYTGNLQDESGERYGFQLTFFRIRTLPPDAEKSLPPKVSAWRTEQVFAAHSALSRISSGRFHHGEKLARGAVELAGTREGGDRFEVFVDGWSAGIGPDAHRLFSRTSEFTLALNLSARNDPVAHGDGGYSRKGDEPSQASCYYSVTRLEVKGSVTLDGRERAVSGSAWMDHEFLSAPLDPRFSGWDWFSLQLSNGSDLMLYFMREKSGEFSAISSGTYVKSDGTAVRLSSTDFRLERKSEWKSPHTGVVYPASWRLEVHPLELVADIAPAMADQEMQSPGSTGVTYWEGSVRAQGRLGRNEPVTAEGYAELTGYGGAVRF